MPASGIRWARHRLDRLHFKPLLGNGLFSAFLKPRTAWKVDCMHRLRILAYCNQIQRLTSMAGYKEAQLPYHQGVETLYDQRPIYSGLHSAPAAF
jgi:hypothetical protein